MCRKYMQLLLQFNQNHFAQGGKLHRYSHTTFTGSVLLRVLEDFALLVCRYRFAIIKGSHELQ